MPEHVIVKLCDFLPTIDSNLSELLSGVEQNNQSSTTTTSLSLIEKCQFSMLKEKLRLTLGIPFSMDMTLIKEHDKFELPPHTLHNYLCCYDLEILYDFGLVICAVGEFIHLFNYYGGQSSPSAAETMKYWRSIPLVDWEIHEMVSDGAFLYASSGSKCAKFNLNVLLNLQPNQKARDAMVWQAQDQRMTNAWGIALFVYQSKKYVYVMDYGSGLIAFDSESGIKLNNMTCPTIRTGYGVLFHGNEMIISNADKNCGPIQIYTFDTHDSGDLLTFHWKLSRQAERIASDQSPYGIHYEKRSDLIYVADTTGRSVSVFKYCDLSRMKTMPTMTGHSHYGIVIDEKRGEMYLPNCNYSICVYK